MERKHPGNLFVRDCITEALFKLMKSKDFNDITVSMLVKTAGVSRNSFYRNYQSMEDIIRQYLIERTSQWWAEYLAHLHPNAVVIVATVRALKQHGGVAFEDLKEENVDALLKGCENLAKHIDTIQQFGLPYVIAINQFVSDTDREIEALENWCQEHGHPMSLSTVWANGGKGAIDLAEKVVALCEKENHYAPLYDVDKTIEEKIETIAKKVYGADGVQFTPEAKEQIEIFNKNGWGKLPICMAKTQMSLSDDGSIMGRPQGFTITVRELRPSLGAGFIVALTGKVLTMPGLPKHPSALDMDIDEDGKIKGLF